jgi:RNA polymerase sigma-70 factor, ECF subfamily
MLMTAPILAAPNLSLPSGARTLRRSTVVDAPIRGSAVRDDSEERRLVERLVADDKLAWRTFARNYTGLVISVIRRVMTRFSRISSEQDVDEIYARFCLELLAHDKKKLRLFDPAKGSRFSTWLGLLATNATYDYLRKLRRYSGTEPLPERDNFASESPSAFDLVALGEQARLAAEILDDLSQRDREFVELYFGEGLGPEEISRRMGISVKTVYTKKHKITARLETIVGRSCEV